MIKSIIVKSMKHCLMCGSPYTETHHAIFGIRRKLADKDGLIIPLCHDCHMYLHEHEDIAMRYRRSAEEAWLQRQEKDGKSREEAIAAFVERYGKNYL